MRFFELKNIDWDSVYAESRRRLQSGFRSDDEYLFFVLQGMINRFRDGHVELASPFDRYTYTGWYENYPTNFLGPALIRSKYVNNLRGNDRVMYGLISEEIGYIYISDFLGDTGDYEIIDTIVEEFQSLQAMVVDVRDNGGGSLAKSAVIASRFADRERIYQYVRYRNGPRRSDFTDFIAHHVAPKGERQFTKPVAVLTNRGCFSTAESFVLMMKAFPHVIAVGDTTGGGAGRPIAMELPNGWTYKVSTWIVYTPGKQTFEGAGLPPDVPAQITAHDENVAKRDTILETAIQRLK
jgi:C-terminal processing protease CtpA/Prc